MSTRNRIQKLGKRNKKTCLCNPDGIPRYPDTCFICRPSRFCDCKEPGVFRRTSFCWKCTPGNFCFSHADDGFPIMKLNCYICCPYRYCFCEGDDKPRQKHKCVNCNPASHCNHGPGGSVRPCRTCPICSPELFCYCMGADRLRFKNICLKCNPSSYCNHGPNGSLRPIRCCPHCTPRLMCKGNDISFCGQVGNQKYRGFCTLCFANLHKDDPLVKNIKKKSKEIEWVNFLTNEPSLSIFKWNCNMPFYLPVDEFCTSKRRIDLWTVIDTIVLCIEIDENQHRSYDPRDEIERYNEIVGSSLQMKYLFIRINPDSYRKDGRIIKTVTQERVPVAVSYICDLLAQKENLFRGGKLLCIQNLFFDS